MISPQSFAPSTAHFCQKITLLLSTESREHGHQKHAIPALPQTTSPDSAVSRYAQGKRDKPRNALDPSVDGITGGPRSETGPDHTRKDFIRRGAATQLDSFTMRTIFPFTRPRLVGARMRERVSRTQHVEIAPDLVGFPHRS